MVNSFLLTKVILFDFLEKYLKKKQTPRTVSEFCAVQHEKQI